MCVCVCMQALVCVRLGVDIAVGCACGCVGVGLCAGLAGCGYEWVWEGVNRWVCCYTVINEVEGKDFKSWCARTPCCAVTGDKKEAWCEQFQKFASV